MLRILWSIDRKDILIAHYSGRTFPKLSKQRRCRDIALIPIRVSNGADDQLVLQGNLPAFLYRDWLIAVMVIVAAKTKENMESPIVLIIVSLFTIYHCLGRYVKLIRVR